MTVSRCNRAPHIPAPGARRPILAAAVAALFLAGWQNVALGQPAGAKVIHGQAQFQQQGTSLTVTTTNGAGSRHSAIDWRSFSVPGGSTTHFQQPSIDSTSINRVTGGNPSQVLGTLSSNGRLVLVNPSGIAFGAGAVVDTAGFTASTLGMSDADALTGRMRFAAAPGGAGPMSVEGRVLARGADVVLLATDLSLGGGALVQAPRGAVIVAAGQRVELTGRGLEGIVFEVAAPTDQVVNLGTLEGDAVGIFASQLQHSGVIRATTVSRVQDKLYLGTLLKKDKDKEDEDKAEKDKKEKEEKDKAEKDKNPDANGNGNAYDNGNGNGNGNNAGSNGNGNNAGGNGNSNPGGVTGPISTDESGGTSGSGGASGFAPAPSDSGSTNTASPGTSSGDSSGTSGSTNPGSSAASGGSSSAPAQPASPAATGAPAPVSSQQAAARTVDAESVAYQGPAVTPSQSLNVAREQERFVSADKDPNKDEKNDTSVMGDVAVCTP